MTSGLTRLKTISLPDSLPDHLHDPAVDSEQFGRDLKMHLCLPDIRSVSTLECYIIALYKLTFTYLLTYYSKLAAVFCS